MNRLAPLTAVNLQTAAHGSYETGAAYPMADEERLFTFRDLFRVLRLLAHDFTLASFLFTVLGLLAASWIAPV